MAIALSHLSGTEGFFCGTGRRDNVYNRWKIM